MSLQITYDDLKLLLEHLESDSILGEILYKFLEVQKDDYYFYGREPLDSGYILIGIPVLGEIVNRPEMIKHGSLHDKLSEVHMAGVVTGQESVYLYGRNRV